MKWTRIVPALVLTLTLLGGAEHSYKSHGDGTFSADFPAELTYKVEKKPTMTVFSAGSLEDETAPAFSVTFTPGPDYTLDSLVEFIHEREPGLTVRQKVVVDKVPGAELSGTVKGIPATMRVFTVKSGAWNVIGRSPDTKENQRFVESFHFHKAP